MVNVVNIGSSSTVSGGTVTITIGAGGVPALAHIFLAVCDNGNGGVAQGSATDTAGNTYASATGFNGSGPYTDIFRERTGKALVNGNTIVYTLSSGGTIAAVDAFYATGLLGAPATANATAQGTSASPSVTSGTPNVGGLFFVGVAGGLTAIASFTQDSTNAAWASPPGQVSLLAPPLGGGNVVNSTATALTYNPTFGTSDSWTAVIAAFRVDPQPGWEVQAPLTVHPRSERSASVMRGDDGNYAPLINFVPFGGHVQPVQPPHPLTERRAAAVMRGDDGNYDIERQFFQFGWPVQPPQPPHPVPERRAGALMRGDDGVEAKEIVWFNVGYEVQSVQPPHPAPERRAAAIMRGDDGIYDIERQWFNVGWGVQDVQPPAIPPRLRGGGIKSRSEFGIFPNLLPMGWDVQSQQPPHPRVERAGGIQIGDTGTFVSQAILTWGFEQTLQPPHPRIERSGAIQPVLNIETLLVQFYVPGWEVQSIQPPHPRPERSGAVQFGDTGTQAVFVPSTVVWGYDPQGGHVAYRLQRGAAIEGRSEFSIPSPPVSGWEIAYTQLRQRTGVGISQPGDGGIYGAIQQWFNAGWEVLAPSPPHPRIERGAALARGDDGTQNALTQFFQFGWPVQPIQPPHPRPERAGAILIGESGIEASFVPPPTPFVWGWHIEPVQPPHYASERRSAAWLRGDDGTTASFINWLVSGWEVQPAQPPHPRTERSGAVVVGDSGIEAPPSAPSVWGWYVDPVQPPHLAPERKTAAVMRGDDGTESQFAVWYSFGWPVQPPQPPHPASERRAAAVMRGNDGTESTIINWFNAGWEVQPIQPPHLRSEKSGAILVGETGIEATIPRLIWGWVVDPIQPPHFAPERRGAAWLRGDDGIEATFAQWLVDGWGVQPFQPPHPRPERTASWLFGENGIEGLYIFSPITVTFGGVGGLSASGVLIPHICVIPGPGPATLPSEPGPGPKVC